MLIIISKNVTYKKYLIINNNYRNNNELINNISTLKDFDLLLQKQ